MKKLKGVLFDMDGVIFDTEKAYLETWTEVFQTYGYELKKETYISIMGTGRDNAVRTFKNVFGEMLPIEEMYKVKDKMLKEIVESGKVCMKPGVKELLLYLKKNNIKTALATSARRWRAEIQLEMAEINGLFDVVVCGDEIRRLKPNPEIFIKTAGKLELEPEECIVIEDSPAGIKAAFDGGMYGIHVEDLKEADENILKCCKANFKNLIEIKAYIKEKVLK
ncbi:HAD family hydrolase [Clostridium butyricum]|uniref:HAD family hydrolase n=1 Tax=Clostridium butyricum TaxID=1492 RepID=UPI0003FD58FB|nr:HAD family phosphatase [Clostridium butyricum]